MGNSAGNALAAYGTPLLRPFDHTTMTPRDVGLGGPSTEYLATEYDSDGRVVNLPLIWWDQQNNPHRLSPKNALAVLSDYETATGLRAPRFDDLGQAVERAMHRSATGGASHSPLFERPYR